MNLVGRVKLDIRSTETHCYQQQVYAYSFLIHVVVFNFISQLKYPLCNLKTYYVVKAIYIN